VGVDYNPMRFDFSDFGALGVPVRLHAAENAHVAARK
jgi:hypothetical protein